MNGFKIGMMSLMMISLLTTGALAADKDSKKIGSLNLSKVFDNYDKTKEYDTALEGQHKRYEKEHNEKIKKIQEAQGRLGILNTTQKAKAEADIEKMKQDLMEYERQIRIDLGKQRDEKRREILLEIEKVVSNFAKKEKYDLILNDVVLIYGDDVLDVTDPILEKLNENYNKK